MESQDNSSNESVATPLPESGVLAGFDSQERQLLADAGEIRTLSSKSYFSSQGKPLDEMAIILEGTFAVSCQARGEIVELATLSAGEVIGEMSVIDPQNASAYVRVISDDARLWVLSASQFNALVDRELVLGFRFLKAVSTRLCKRIRRNSESMLRLSEQNRTQFLDMDY
ncbi:MAG: CRP/FNR family cyclic AMP-dependent transcriptional regulator [Verrucomicrobiales bacterium]|jgi:CRP/FNR family cyclic AMP-dependent transcriptional regulator